MLGNENTVQPPTPNQPPTPVELPAQAPVIQPTPPAPSTSHDPIKRLKILLVLFVIIAVLGIATYAMGAKIKPTPTATPTPLAVIKPTPTPDPTADWKTYTSTLNKYSIKIPLDWIIDDHNGVFVNIPGEVTFTPPNEMKIQIDSFRTKIAITVMSTQKIRYSLNTQEQFDEWFSMKPASDVRRPAKVENLKIDELDAVKFINNTLPGDATEPFFSTVVWFRKNGNNYYIELGGANEQTVNKNIATFDQILSTFKFLSSSSSSATLNEPENTGTNAGIPVAP